MSKRNKNAQRQRAMTMFSWGVALLVALGVGSCAVYYQKDSDSAQASKPVAHKPAVALTNSKPETAAANPNQAPIGPIDTAKPHAADMWVAPEAVEPIAPTTHTFVLRSDENYRTVAVAGSFNGWSKDANPMQRQADGSWRAEVALPEGVHHYKFVADGDHWLTDPASDRELEIDDTFGGHNSAVLVGLDARKLGLPEPDAVDAQAVCHRPADPADADVVSPTLLRLAIRAQAGDVESVAVHYQAKGETQWRSQPLYKQTTNLGFERFGGMIGVDHGPVRYVFELADGSAKVYFGARGIASTRDDAARAAFVSQMTPRVTPPEWAQHAVWYQIFPERFRNGDTSNDPPNTKKWTSDWWATLPGEAPGPDNFYKGKGNVWQRRYGGDVQGLIQALPYLRELGINAIYLNPIFEAESMHKYDTADYRHVDQHFGTKGDIAKLTGETDDPATWQWTETDKLFLKFVDEAHKQGFRVIIDGVFNHVGRAHPFFQDVLKNGKNSKYAGWFDVRDWNPPIKYIAWDTNGDAKPDGALPVFKKDGKTGLVHGPREHIMAIAKRWLAPDGDPSKGIDGFRLDVPGDIPHPFWVDWCKLVRQTKPDAYISGEVWTWAQPWLQGDQFDAVMNYRFMETGMQFFVNQRTAIPPTQFNVQCFDLVNNYSFATAMAQMNLFDSHDTDRFASMFVNPDLPFDGANRLQDNGPNYRKAKPNDEQWTRMKQAVTWQMTFVGSPMIYYGDEAGMWGPDDPSNRQPMIWRDLQPYDDPQVAFKPDLFEHYQRLIALRAQKPALQTGSFRPVLVEDTRNVYAYVRELNGEAVYVVLNRAGAEQSVEIQVNRDGSYINWADPAAAALRSGDRPKLVAKDRRITATGNTLKLTVPAYGASILSMN